MIKNQIVNAVKDNRYRLEMYFHVVNREQFDALPVILSNFFKQKVELTSMPVVHIEQELVHMYRVCGISVSQAQALTSFSSLFAALKLYHQFCVSIFCFKSLRRGKRFFEVCGGQFGLDPAEFEISTGIIKYANTALQSLRISHDFEFPRELVQKDTMGSSLKLWLKIKLVEQQVIQIATFSPAVITKSLLNVTEEICDHVCHVSIRIVDGNDSVEELNRFNIFALLRTKFKKNPVLNDIFLTAEQIAVHRPKFRDEVFLALSERDSSFTMRVSKKLYALKASLGAFEYYALCIQEMRKYTLSEIHNSINLYLYDGNDALGFKWHNFCQKLFSMAKLSLNKLNDSRFSADSTDLDFTIRFVLAAIPKIHEDAGLDQFQ